MDLALAGPARLVIPCNMAGPAGCIKPAFFRAAGLLFSAVPSSFPLQSQTSDGESLVKSLTAHKEPITQMPRKTSRSEETLLFAKNFIQHPLMLGSLIPSSRFLIDRLLSKVDWDRARTIVEYGPGVGTITAHILARMSPDARLVVFEMNNDFVRYLGR